MNCWPAPGDWALRLRPDAWEHRDRTATQARPGHLSSQSGFGVDHSAQHLVLPERRGVPWCAGEPDAEHVVRRRLVARRRCGDDHRNTSSGGGALYLGSIDSRFQTSTGGVQFGVDEGLYNINASGMNVHAGITGGQVWGYSTLNRSSDPSALLNVSGNAGMPF